jgi:hypothetical protein
MKKCSIGTRKCHTGQCFHINKNNTKMKCKKGTRKCSNNKCYLIKNKISFLFLTYSDLLHGDVIKKYTKNHDVFIHPKYNLTNDYFKKKIIPEIVETNWGSISIVYATINLLKNAFYRTNNNWFVLLSQDVYPLTKIADFEYFLSKQTNSCFEYQTHKSNIYKTSQWWILNRKDVSIILENYEKFISKNVNFKSILGAMDELFFLTLLKWNNSNYTYTNFSNIYTWWVKHAITKHPVIFNHITQDDHAKIKNKESFFIRKTLPTFTPTIYKTNKELIIIFIGTKSIQNYNDLLNKNYDIIIITSIDINEINQNIVSACMYIYSIIYKFYYENFLALLNEININNWEKITFITESFDINELKYMKVNDKLQLTNLPIQNKLNPNLRNNNIFYTLMDSNKQLIHIIKNNTNVYSPQNAKIAFLFLIIDDINHPEIWEKYFKNNLDRINIYVHPKHPENVKTPWLKKNIIQNLVNTEWGFITNAYYHLFEEAFKNKDNIKFVTISESCLPLQPFHKFYNDIFTKNDIRTSFVKFQPVTRYDLISRIKNQPNFNMFKTYVKHYARFCLSRYHIEKLLRLHNEFNFFNNMQVGDEFFLTMLKAKPNYDFFKDYEITYDDWDYITNEREQLNLEIKKMYELIESQKYSDNVNKIIKNEIENKQIFRDNISKNPKTYNVTTIDDYHKALKSGAYFWRKFPKTAIIPDYTIQNLSSPD